MIAVVQTGGKQYKVSEGDEIQVEKLDGKVGESINLEKVLVCGEGESNKVGTPFLEGCSVVCEVTEQFRGKKIIVFKKRRRQNYRLTQGHRQYLTVLKIESINHKGKKTVLKKETKVSSTTSKELKVEDNKKSKKKIVKKTTSAKKTTKPGVKKKVVAKKVTKSKK